MPAQFISIAEDSGLILPIGRLVLLEACRQARSWYDAGYRDVSVAVNVSALELLDDGFLEGVLGSLRQTQLEPRLLELELTESVLMKRIEPSIVILKILRDRGIHLAIDDFGTGYSSLSYLRKFPIDTLKIDQSFVRQIDTSGGDAAIVTAVTNMARSLKLRIVAEGVETKAEMQFLKSHDCDQAQGYYFSKPVPALEFAHMLERGIASTIVPRQPWAVLASAG
jgi:EAL domain-containing protein (putative c-di-GMP-specific phosphodiesterase class I)